MPAPPINQTLGLQGDADVKARVLDVGNTFATAFKGAQGSAEGLGGSLTNAAALVSSMRGSVGELGQSMGGLQAALLSAGPALEALVGAASIDGLFKLAESASEATHEIETMATAFGSSNEEIESFHAALATVGVSSEAANTALRNMLAYIGQTDIAVKKAAESSQLLADSQNIAAQKTDIAADASAKAAANLQAALAASALGIDKANLTVDQATNAYQKLRKELAGVSGDAQTNRDNSLKLRAAQLQVAEATQAVADAQRRQREQAQQLYDQMKRDSLARDEAKLAAEKEAAARDKELNSTQAWLVNLGVTTEALGEATQDGVKDFYKVIDALNQLPNAADRASKSKDIFKRSWLELAPAIKVGSEAMLKSIEEFDHSSLKLREDDFTIGETFRQTIAIFGVYSTAIRNIIGLDIAKALTPQFQALNHWIVNNADNIRYWGEQFGAALTDAIKAFNGFVSVIVAVAGPAFRAVYAMFDGLAFIINKTFGTDLTAAELIFDVLFAGMALKIAKFISAFTGIGAAVVKFGGWMRNAAEAAQIFAGAGASTTAAWGSWLVIGGAIVGIIALLIYNFQNWDSQVAGWTAALDGFWVLLKAIAGWFADTWVAVFNQALSNFMANWQGIKDYIGSWVTWFQDKMSAVAQFFSDAWNNSISFVEGLWNGLVDWVSGAYTKITGWLRGMLDWVNQVVNGLLNMIGLSGNAGSANGWQGGEVRAAGGGKIIGPGTGTSDSVPAMLSNGEFVVNAHAAQGVGYDFLHAINSGAQSFMRMGGIVRMALGGLAGSLAPQRFASGGIVAAGAGMAGMAPVHIHLGGSTFELLGQRGVVGALTGAARKASIASTGTAPSWKR